MKITGVETYPVSGQWLFVVVDTDEGTWGVGESGLSMHELAVIGAIEHFKPWLIGQDPARIEYIWQGLARGRFFPIGPVAAAALSAIDVALWDIRGKVHGVPVYQLLGGRVRDRAVCYTGLGDNGYDIGRLIATCQERVSLGWKALRWTTPFHVETREFDQRVGAREAVKQMRAVRDAVGEDIEICFDIHTRLDLPEAIRVCREAEPLHPFFMEDPLRAESPRTYRELRHHVSVPIAAGEQFAGKWQFRELIDDDLIDYVRADTCLIGGISEAKKIAGWAEAHNIKMALHNPLGPVSTAACAHIDLAIDNFGIQEQHGIPGKFLTDLFPVQIPWADGYLLPPDRPGLGIEFDREAARRHPFQLGHGQYMLRRPDGALTNV